MPYVARDGTGNIVAVSLMASAEAKEAVADDAPELHAFLQRMAAEHGALQSSDLRLIRAIEDVIDLLIHKNVICITDLPPAVQAKLTERRSLRHSLNALKLIGEDDQGVV